MFLISVQETELCEIYRSFLIIVYGLKDQPIVIQLQLDSNAFHSLYELFKIQAASEVSIEATECLPETFELLLDSAMDIPK